MLQKGQINPQELMKQNGHTCLEDMIQNLLELDYETWGLYAFSRDLLNGRIPAGEKLEMIAKAAECGKTYAKHIISRYGKGDVRKLAWQMGLKIEVKDFSAAGNRIVFARYTKPDSIVLYQEPVKKAARVIADQAPCFIELFGPDDLMDILLGHEIFHFIEDRFENEIYTRTQKVLLWNLFGIKNYSSIRALSEIGAMSFTMELNKLTYYPFVLDVLMYFGFNPSGAEKIYRDVMNLSLEK